MVEYIHGSGGILRRSDCAEFETVAGEGEWRSAVAVGIVEDDFGHCPDDAERLAVGFLAGKIFHRHDVFDDTVERGAGEHRHDCRRGLAAAQTIGVAQGGYAAHQQEIMVADAFQDAGEEAQEPQVAARGLARREEVGAAVGAKGPVAVLAAAVYTLEGLFMEDDLQVMARGNLLHDDHQQHVLVDGRGGRREDGGALELIGSHFIMTSIGR